MKFLRPTFVFWLCLVVLFAGTAVKAGESSSQSKVTRVIALSDKVVPLDVVIQPVEFISVLAKKPVRVGKRSPLFFKVRAQNLGNKDYYTIISVTLLTGSGETVAKQTNKESLDEGDGKTSIGIRFYKLTETQLASVAKYKLDLSIVEDD